MVTERAKRKKSVVTQKTHRGGDWHREGSVWYIWLRQKRDTPTTLFETKHENLERLKQISETEILGGRQQVSDCLGRECDEKTESVFQDILPQKSNRRRQGVKDHVESTGTNRKSHVERKKKGGRLDTVRRSKKRGPLKEKEEDNSLPPGEAKPNTTKIPAEERVLGHEGPSHGWLAIRSTEIQGPGRGVMAGQNMSEKLKKGKPPSRRTAQSTHHLLSP